MITSACENVLQKWHVRVTCARLLIDRLNVSPCLHLTPSCKIGGQQALPDLRLHSRWQC